MLTAYQLETGAYQTEEGVLLCEQCFENGQEFARPISNYELGEWQFGNGEGLKCAIDADGDEHWIDEYEADDVKEAGGRVFEKCEPALMDDEGHELQEAYHYHPEVRDDA